jgi:hypothetical protein
MLMDGPRVSMRIGLLNFSMGQDFCNCLLVCSLYIVQVDWDDLRAFTKFPRKIEVGFYRPSTDRSLEKVL